MPSLLSTLLSSTLLLSLLHSTLSCCGMYQVIDLYSPYNTSSTPSWSINSFYNLVDTVGSLSLPDDPASKCIGSASCYDFQTTLYAANLTQKGTDCTVSGTTPSYSCDSLTGGCSMQVQQDNACRCSGLEELQVQFEVPSNFFVVQVNGVFVPSANASNWVWSGGKLQWPSFIWGPTGTVGSLGPAMPTWPITALIPTTGSVSNTMGTVSTYTLSPQWADVTGTLHLSDVDHWQDASITMPIDQSTLVYINPNTSALTSSGFFSGWFSGEGSVGGGFLGALDWFVTGGYSFVGSNIASWKPVWPAGAPLPTPWYTVRVDKTNPGIWSCGGAVDNDVVFQVWSTGEWDAPLNGYTKANQHYARGGNTTVVWGSDHTKQCAYCSAAHLNALNLHTPDWTTSWYSYTQSSTPNSKCRSGCSSGCSTPHMTCTGYSYKFDFQRHCPSTSSSSSSTTAIRVSGSSSSARPGFSSSSSSAISHPTSNPLTPTSTPLSPTSPIHTPTSTPLATPTSTPTPPPSTPTSAPSIRGDPAFVGLRGQSFQIHGLDGSVYSIITDPTFQLNSRFAFLTGPRPCPVMPSTGLPSVACWAHDGSYLADLGLVTSGGDRVHVVAGMAKDGFSRVEMNGRRVAVGEVVALRYRQESMGYVQLNSTHELTIVSPPWRIEVESSDGFVNLRSVSVTAAAMRGGLSSHGLLGQTWSARRWGGQVKEIEGEVDDYVIVSDDVFGSDHVFDRFGKEQ